MREIVIENYLVEQVSVLGGEAIKFGQNAWPDRIVVLPHSKLIWVECKKPGGKPRPDQQARIKLLKSLGQHVAVIDTKAKVDAMIKWYIRSLSKV